MGNCRICGGAFESISKTRKYCDYCAKHRDHLLRQYKKELKYGGQIRPLDRKCHICNNKFLVFEHSLLTRNGYSFCSEECERVYIRSTAVCLNCGKSLADKIGYSEKDMATHFCCPECKEEYKDKEAVRNGLNRVCEYCGKPFIRKSGKFCSIACYNNAVADGWKPPVVKKREPDTPVRRYEVCAVCGQTSLVTYKDKKHIPRIYFCGELCHDKYKAAKNGRKKKERMVKHDISLCLDCKVNYKDCLRMSSSFSLLPEGADINDKGMVVKCPSYIKG